MRYFWTFCSVGFARAAPRIDPLHSSFFNGHMLPIRYGCFDFPEPSKPLRVAKNVFNLAPAFTVSTSLVVSETVRSIIEPRIRCQWQPVIFDLPFMFPYTAGDESYEKSDQWISSRYVEPIIARFAEAYRCESPKERYLHVLPSVTRKLQVLPPDTRECRIRDPDHGLITTTHIVFSPTLLSLHGLMRGGGHNATEEVFELLNPFLRRPYFWCGRLEVESGTPYKPPPMP